MVIEQLTYLDDSGQVIGCPENQAPADFLTPQDFILQPHESTPVVHIDGRTPIQVHYNLEGGSGTLVTYSTQTREILVQAVSAESGTLVIGGMMTHALIAGDEGLAVEQQVFDRGSTVGFKIREHESDLVPEEFWAKYDELTRTSE